jgi:hypothetical protein
MTGPVPTPGMGTPPLAADAGTVNPAPIPPPPATPQPPAPLPPPPAPQPPPSPSATITFDPPGGNFIGTQAVRLVSGVSDTVIRFTVDGTRPTAASPVFNRATPIMLRETTMIQAIGNSPSAGPVRETAAVYVRASNDVASFESNLPIVLLHSQKSGTLGVSIGTPPVEGSVSVFEPGPNGRTRLVGPATFTRQAGLRIRGNSSRTSAQKSYAFELRNGDKTDDDRSVVGLPSDSDWNLIAPSRTDRSLVRTAVAFTLSNEIQRYAPRIRMVEVFTVESGPTGTVGMNTYKGVYTLTEKIKVGKNRVRISAIDPAARTEPSISGGYVFKIDHPTGFGHWRVDGICHCVGNRTNNMPFQLVDPDWDQLPAASQTAFSGYLRGYLQEFFNAVNAADFRNPATGTHYSEYIDVPAWIDHNLLNAVFKNVDGLRLSAYFHKERNGKVVAGPLWDMDLSSGTPFDDQFGRRTEEAREWFRVDGTHPLTYAFWGRLYADPVYRAAYNRRFAELAAGPFSVAHIQALIDRFAGELREAKDRHFARYPEYPPTGGSHANEIRILKDWFAARIPWMAGELR